jgi:hypothetical protein
VLGNGIVTIDQGWDSIAELVDGGWLDRRPRRPSVAERLRRECRLMPWLAPQLPLTVPIPRILNDDPLVVRHALVPGEPVTAPTAGHGQALGVFLRALHDVPTEDALAHGLAPADDVHQVAARFRSTVLPMVDDAHRSAAASLLDQLTATPRPTREQRTRALLWHRLGPWHAVEHGLEVNDQAEVRSGLDGLVQRLTPAE